jgi:D-alanyl-D-alanine dipeptidase
VGEIALLLLALGAPAALAQPAGFVDAATAVPGLAVEMRYFGTHNFVGTRIDGYEAPRCLLARQAAVALAGVERDLAARGLGLKVFDCYRPARAVAHFVRWTGALADLKTKAEFYPRTDKRNLFKEGYISSRSGHSRGATVDLTLVRLDAGAELGGELDMGTPFDFFGPQSWPSYPGISDEARRNRALLAEAMRRGGFRPYAREWWHFTLAREPFPSTYFDFPVR